MIFLTTVGSFLIAFLLAWGLNSLALIPWRKSVGKHWTERARLLYPARKAAGLNILLIPANITLSGCILFPGLQFLATTVPAFLGSLLGGYFMSREIYPDLRLKSWLHLVVVFLVLFFLRWLLVIIAIFTMPKSFGLATWLAAGGIFLSLLSLQLGMGVRLLQWLQLLKPATTRLNAIVSDVSRKMNVRVNSTWLLGGPVTNAFAAPVINQLIFAEKILQMHPDDEIRAICAHELGHLNEPRSVVLARILVALAFFPLVFAQPMISLGTIGGLLFLLLVAGSLITWAMGIRLSNRMEKRADRIAAENQENPAVYARALEVLYQANQMPAVMPPTSKKIHPDLYDRMTAAGVVPLYKRPKPPHRMSWTVALFYFAALVQIGILIGRPTETDTSKLLSVEPQTELSPASN